MRRWELVSGGSAKFWEIGQDGASVTVRFGRLGTAGQTQTKELTSAQAAAAHVAKLVAEKEKKGYRDPGTAGGAAPAVEQPAAEVPTAVEPTAVEPAVDETTWVMPKVWLRDVVRQRGFDPAPVFSVDPELAQDARQRVVTQSATTIERVLSEPASDPHLVQAAREHLAGRPDPVGAAATATILGSGPQSAHAWIADHGVAFAAAAAVEYTGMVSHAEWIPQQQTRGSERLTPRGGYFHIIFDSPEGKMLTAVRYALAVADEAERAAAEAVLERMTGPTAELVRVYLMPARADWFRKACNTPHSGTRWWILPCSASTYDEFDQAGSTVSGPAFLLHTAIHVLGPAVAPLLAKELDHQYQHADSRKQVLKVLAALPTDEAFTILLDRVDTRYVRPALLSAMAAFPARAARLLAERASGNAELRQLLSVHLTAHPHLEVPEGFTAVESAAVPEAPADALPPVLASPPWLNRRPPVVPVVVPDLPVPAPSIVWEPGEREEWQKIGGWRSHQTWQHLMSEFHAGRIGYRMRDLFALAPEDEVRHLLADWDPKLGWNAESTGKLLAARFGFDALAPLLRTVESNSTAAVIVLPFATPEVAALMADWFVRLKQVRKVALEWLARHRETAARFLVPAALGKPGAQRRNAEAAVRQLHTMGVDVVAAAPDAAAAAGLEALLSIDPVDVLPAKLPVIGGWADTRLLPQVLLRDRKHALSPEAARHLLMTAALSKPGDVYAGLPIAREALDRDSLAEFAWAVFRRWQEVGAPPKEGWALTALGWFGDDSTVRALSPLIRVWPGESQHAKAVVGLDVLADIGTEVALSHLNSIAEKVKFKGLKTRAQEKVSQIAAELGLSRDQLADRLVPRLGLDDEGSLAIDYGPRRFTVGFDEQLKPYVLDPDGKRRKDLPKPGAKDDPERAPLEHKRFMALKKDVRTVASDQIHRLERAMVDQRTWTADEFHTVLAGHPLLWHIVRRLVWITDAGLSFRLAEDRTLADSSDDEVTLPENATVRVAHPVDLQDTVESWGEVFADYEILQPFPQLGRPVHVVPAGEDLLPRLTKYCDVLYPVGRILSLTKKGWVRGEPQDAGVECWITRPLPSGGALVASLDPGIAVGSIDVFPEIKFAGLWYSADAQGYWSSPKNAPSTFEVDPITLSELLSELESLHS